MLCFDELRLLVDYRENLFFNHGPLNKVNIHELEELSLVIIWLSRVFQQTEV
jgi:hypothetical protein